jgi:hypothetical protein
MTEEQTANSRRRVLIVSPHFPPTNAADMHRVRLSLPFYLQFGWEPTVLAVDSECVEATREPELLQTVPDDVPVHRVRAIPARWTRRVGFSALALRAAPHMYREGIRLLKRQRADLLFFSTTMFPAMALGRLWKQRFGTPLVLDMQDPWVSDYPQSGDQRPHKHRWARRMHQTLEPWTMRAVDGLIAVSENYHRVLRERYPWIPEWACLTLPFAASSVDFEVSVRSAAPNRQFDATDGFCHGVYAGRLGPDMRLVCRAICDALAAGLRENPELFRRVRLHFVGTDYAVKGAGKPTILPIAQSMGLADFISEQPERLPYLEVLRLLKAADFLVVPGSDDPAYTASKLYPYILARRPLLAVFHKSSSVVEIVRTTQAGDVVTFESADSGDEVARRLLPAWRSLLARLPFEPPTDLEAFEPYTAREMTRRQCELFDRIVANCDGSRVPNPELVATS